LFDQNGGRTSPPPRFHNPGISIYTEKGKGSKRDKANFGETAMGSDSQPETQRSSPKRVVIRDSVILTGVNIPGTIFALSVKKYTFVLASVRPVQNLPSFLLHQNFLNGMH